MTVTLDLRFEVSRRIKDEFENGRDYYALQGKPVAVPEPRELAPSREYLEWHGANVFQG